MQNVIPGILENDSLEIEKKLSLIKQFSKKIHVDILDGNFSQDTNFIDPSFFKKYENDFFMEVHLMVDNPASYVGPFAQNGFKRFLGHVERMKNLDEFIAEGQIFGEIGLALDIETPVESILVNFDDIDTVLLMGVKAGKSGQLFMPEVLNKIRALRAKTNIPIEVDGGINPETLIDCKEEGATRFVATSYIFNNKDPMQAFEKLLSLS